MSILGRGSQNAIGSRNGIAHPKFRQSGGCTAHPTPPPRFRSVDLALSGRARKFGYAQNDTACGQCPLPKLDVYAMRTWIPMALCVYCSKISHGGSQGLIAVFRACEASAEATGRASAETNSAPHTRRREKLSPRGTKKGSTLLVLPNEGS